MPALFSFSEVPGKPRVIDLSRPISQFALSSCVNESCTSIKSTKATESGVFRNISFNDAEVFYQTQGHEVRFKADGYYDPKSKMIYLTEVKSGAGFQSAYIDMQNLQLVRL